MKHKKLIWTRFAVALLALAMALGLVACGKKEGQSSATGADPTEESISKPDSREESTSKPDSPEESTTGGEDELSPDDSGAASDEHDDIKDYESVWKITTAG